MLNENVELREKIKKLYMYFLDYETISDEKLDVLGFTDSEKLYLLDDKIVCFKDNYYYIIKRELFYIYGKSFAKRQNYDMAMACFQKFSSMDNNNVEVLKQMMLIAVKIKDSETFISLLEKLLTHKSKFVRCDANFYLYLYNLIGRMPKELVLKAKNISFYDVQIDFRNKLYSDTISYNKVRRAALLKSFPNAIYLLNELIAKHDGITLDEQLTKVLLSIAGDRVKVKQDYLLRLLAKDDYQAVATVLAKRSKFNNLTKAEFATLDITSRLANGILQQKEYQNYDNEADIFKVISLQDYRLALKMSNERLEQFNIKKNTSLLNAVLVKANDYLDNKEKDNSVKNGFLNTKINNDLIHDLENFKIIFSNKNKEEFYEFLEEFVINYNIFIYKNIIILMFNIALLENTDNYDEVLNVINKMISGIYTFDVISYLKKYKNAIYENKHSIADCYLNILKEGEALGYINDASQFYIKKDDSAFEDNMHMSRIRI